ncbi:MAG: hypothetical protein IJS15_04830 [Victivallales bacterium]|nr:hypothetical protein [Victivallales bacterium]
MKSKLLMIAGTGIALVLAGCATHSDYVESHNINKAVKNPYTMSSSDFVKAADEAIVFLMASNELKEYLDEYAQNAELEFKKNNPDRAMPARLKRPTLILNTIVNNTANEFSGGDYFDPKFLTERIRGCLANPNQLNETLLAMQYYNREAYDRLMRMTGGYFTAPSTPQVRPRTDLAGQGHTVDTAIQDSGEVDSVFGPLAQPGNTPYFDLSLNGSISKMAAHSGRRSEVSYLFALTLSDSRTKEAIWTWSIEIKRQHSRGVFGP